MFWVSEAACGFCDGQIMCCVSSSRKALYRDARCSYFYSGEITGGRLRLDRGMAIFKVESASISKQNTLFLGMEREGGQLVDTKVHVFYGV